MAPLTFMPRLSVREVEVNFGSGFLIFLDQNSMMVAQLVALAAGPRQLLSLIDICSPSSLFKNPGYHGHS